MKALLAILTIMLFTGCQSYKSAYFASNDSRAMAESAKKSSYRGIPKVTAVDKSSNSSGGSNTSAQVIQNTRMVIYNGHVYLVVEDLPQAGKELTKLALKYKGYVQSSTTSHVSMRIPATSFRDAIKDLETIGKISSHNISSTDITEQMFDLQTRLKNAENTRNRLLTILKDSKKVEDTLKIEKELDRLTEKIERYKGKIRFYSNQVAFSTLKVTLNSPVPAKAVQTRLPFYWIYQLGSGMQNARVPSPKIGSWTSRKIAVNYPKGFMKIYEKNNTNWAMNGDSVYIKVNRHLNVAAEGTSNEFWLKLIKKNLLQRRLIKINDTGKTENKKADYLYGTRFIGGKKYDYLIVIISGKKHVCTYEAWGTQDQMQKLKKDLINSADKTKTKLNGVFN